MKIIAEGVENKKQLLNLQALNCKAFQGNYFSKPLSPQQLQNFLKKQKVPRIPTNPAIIPTQNIEVFNTIQ
jgi:EAL domain-containing protein (putative c-di-GMP-specific phosphodiesterase class I)